MLSSCENFFLKVANLDISNDSCGGYIIRIYGQRANYFRIIDNALYMIQPASTLPATPLTITLSIEDPAKRFTPITRDYTLNVRCLGQDVTTTTIEPTTTTAGPTTTTTQAPVTSTTQSLTTPNPLP